MLPSMSATAEMPVGSMTLISSSPGFGVWFAEVVAESVGSAMFGSAPVVNVWSGVSSHLPSGHWMRARTWYVVDAFIPAMRIDTGPPPGGDGTGAVERP